MNPGDKGDVLTINRGEVKFSLGFGADDGIVLREWLKFALERIFNGLYSEAKKRGAAHRKSEESEVEVEPAVETASEREEEDIPF